MSLDDDEDDVVENYNDENDRILEHDNDEDDENDENDENDLEMFLSFLKVAVGGTTCKDLENWFLLTEDWSATDFSIFTIFCGCEGVQSATFCPNGNPVTTPDKDITEFVMLIMSLDDDEDDVVENYNDENDRILEHDNDEDDENDEVDLEMFLSNLKDVVGGTTCKDLENWVLLTNSSATDFSTFTFFCGCEGVQSCAKNLCPYGYKLPFPEKMLSGVGDLPKTTTCAEAREIASNFPDSNDQEKDSCSAYVRDIARYCECPCMGG